MLNKAKSLIAAIELTTATVMKRELPASCKPSTAKETGEFIAKTMRLQGYMIAGDCPDEILSIVDLVVGEVAQAKLDADGAAPLAKVGNRNLN